MSMKEDIVKYVACIDGLKKDLRCEKMLHTKLKKKLNGHLDNEAVEGQSWKAAYEQQGQDVERLTQELDASRRECGKLTKEYNDVVVDVGHLEDQVFHFQQLITHTAAVTTWKVLDE